MMQTHCMLLITDTRQNNVQSSLLKHDETGLTTTDALDFLNSTCSEVPTQVMLSAEQSQISSNFTVPVKKCIEIEI